MRLIQSPFPYIFGIPISTTVAARRCDRVVHDLLEERDVLLSEHESDLVWIDLEQGEFLPATEPLPPPHIFRDLFQCIAAKTRKVAGASAVVSRREGEELRWHFVHGLAKILFGFDQHLEELRTGMARRFVQRKVLMSAPTCTAGSAVHPDHSAEHGGPSAQSDFESENAPIAGFDEHNAYHLLVRSVAESQDFQMFVQKKAKLYASIDHHNRMTGREAKHSVSEYEAFDWLCAYELRRARQNLR